MSNNTKETREILDDCTSCFGCKTFFEGYTYKKMLFYILSPQINEKQNRFSTY